MAAEFPIIEPDELDDALDRAGLMLLDFWQVGCAPCRALEPRQATLAGRHYGAFTGYRIDIDTDPATPARFDVMSIPLVQIRGPAKVARRDGLLAEANERPG